MRLALISDIHANLPALKAVLARLDELGFDELLCLGDVVGYGAQPAECLDMILDREIPCLLGNHDAGVAGLLDLDHFREPNRSIIRWTTKTLKQSHLYFLQEFPLITGGFDGLWTAAHASPVKPGSWPYLNTASVCRSVLEQVPETFVFVGHTHVPGLVADEIGVFGVQPGHRYVINPGSVGQSRDGDPRASAGIFDFEAYQWQPFRVEYDVEEALRAFPVAGFTMEQGRQLLMVE